MDKHGFETVSEFQGHSLQYFTSHSELVRMQQGIRAAKKAEYEATHRAAVATAVQPATRMVTADTEWDGDKFVHQSDALARG
jgi:hypothetical protein